MNDDITRWRPTIHEVRDLLDLDADMYPDAVVLALIEVESAGDPTAHRDGSQFWGLLQMGELAGLDVGIDDTSTLDGNGYAAIRAFMEYQERYSERHRYQPSRIAALWKAGPGTLGRISELLIAGEALDAAIERAAAEKGVPHALEYVRRFRAARERWAEA